MPVKRCGWCEGDELYIEYHDKEWGEPVFDDRLLFELLILEGAQAGLSWLTVLKKRENYKAVFDNFDYRKVARYDKRKIEKLLQNPGIIRNKLKVGSAVRNAKAYIEVVEEEGSFADYIWKFVDGVPIKNAWRTMKQIPASTPVSDAMSKDLKARGFNFIGSTICYAYMQSIGMVNDHLVSCYRYNEVGL